VEKLFELNALISHKRQKIRRQLRSIRRQVLTAKSLSSVYVALARLSCYKQHGTARPGCADLFMPSDHCLMHPSCGTPCDINTLYTSKKSTLQFRR